MMRSDRTTATAASAQTAAVATVSATITIFDSMYWTIWKAATSAASITQCKCPVKLIEQRQIQYKSL